MRQTLFTISQWWLEGPLLIGWLVIGLLIFAWLVYRHGWKSEALNFLPVYVAGAAIIWFIAPRIGITDINPDDPLGPDIPAGLAIRGYGVMLLSGIIAGVGLSMWRAQRRGFDPDRILSLAFWACASGIVGARLFYVIQKHQQFGGSPLEMLGDMVNMTQGGLVVYGSLIGGSIGGLIYLWRTGLPVFKMADITAPGMALGLALGRIGCLMNGCCFGGTCDLPSIAQPFPAGSPPYVRQLETGELLGIESVTGEEAPDQSAPPQPELNRYATDVEPDSLADQAGVQSERWFRIGFPVNKPIDKLLRASKQKDLEIDATVVVQQDSAWRAINFSQLPERSLGVYPTQLIASLNAALLTVLLILVTPFVWRDGQVFALLLILYSVTRFLIELIRRDEYGQFGTGLTISQLVSIAMVAGGIALFLMAPRRDESTGGRASNPPASHSA